MTRKIVVFGARELDDLVRLRLIPNGRDEGVRLVAVDADGEQVPCGSLLKITSGGVYFHSGVNIDLGFALGEYGRLRKV